MSDNTNDYPVIIAAGQRFELKLTYGLAKALRKDNVVDLLGADVADQVAKLLFDLDKVGRAVWLLIEAQAWEEGICEEDVIDGLEPADIVAMREALQRAVLNFIRIVRSELSQATEKVLAKQQQIKARQAQAVIDYVTSDRIDRRVDLATSRLLEEVDSRIDRDLERMIASPSSKSSGS